MCSLGVFGPPYSTHPYILGNKREKSRFYFYASVLSFSAIQHIQADLNIAIFLMLSIFPLISRSTSFFSKLLRNVLNAPNTIGITIPFMFKSFFNCLTRLMSLSSVSLPLMLKLLFVRTGRSTH